MDINTSLETKKINQSRSPEIRQLSTLDNIPRIVSPKPILTAEKVIKPPQEKSNIIKFFIIGLLVFGILGLELAIIFRYDKLNKRLYKISMSHKNRAAVLQKKLMGFNRIRDTLIASRRGLFKSYTSVASQNKILQFKLNNYKNISEEKLSKIDILKGDLRVYDARVGAVNAQNELLKNEVKKKDEYISELTAKLVGNIKEQETLLIENILLNTEIEKLTYELKTPRTARKTRFVEDRDANK